MCIRDRPDAVLKLAERVDPEAGPAIGCGQFHEIGQAVRIAVRITAFVGQFLPLADHPHPFIVEDEDFHRQAVLADRTHFLNVHLERGFARDADDQAVRVRDLCADGGGESVAHRAEPARGEPAVGRGKAEMLRRPHLVLADFGGDDRIAAAGRVEQRLDRTLRHDFGARVLLFGKVEAARRAPPVNACLLYTSRCV